MSFTIFPCYSTLIGNAPDSYFSPQAVRSCVSLSRMPSWKRAPVFSVYIL